MLAFILLLGATIAQHYDPVYVFTGMSSHTFNQTAAPINYTQLHSIYPAFQTNMTIIEIYHSCILSLRKMAAIKSEIEFAAFMANILHESDSFRHKSETACQTTGCKGQYGDDNSGPVYYGRGFIQLSWKYNYEAASKDLYGDDRLVKEPQRVSEDNQVAWDTALWYWRTQVHDKFNPNDFASSVQAINGQMECGGKNMEQTNNRYRFYKQILAILKPGTVPLCSCPGVQ